MFITLAAATALLSGISATPSGAAGTGAVNAPAVLPTLSIAVASASGSGAALPPTPAGYTTTVLVAPLGTNLILQSEAIATSPWGGSSTVTADSTLAPDGTTTADTLTQASGGDSRSQQFTIPPSGIVNFSVDLKQSVGSAQYLTVSDAGTGATAHLGITWSGGIPSLASLGNSAGASSGGFSAALTPNGFYRISYWVSGLTGGNTGQLFIHPSNAGSNGDAVIAWGAQVTEGTGLLPYFKTTTAPVSIIAGAWGTGAVQAPTVQGAASVTPAAIAGTGSVHGPTVRGDATVAVALAAGTGVVNAPTGLAGLAVTLSSVTGSGSVNGPAVRGDVSVALTGAAGVGAVIAPSPRGDISVTLAAVAATGVPHAPSVRGDAALNLSGVVGTGAVNAPSTSPLVTVTPSAAAGTAVVHAPTAAPSLGVSLGSASGTGAINAPTVSAVVHFSDTIPAIIAGLTSAQSETHGWNAEVKAVLLANPSSVVRTSDTVVTITLPAVPLYNITAQETITATIPGSSLAGGLPIVAAPTFVVGTFVLSGAAGTGAVNLPSLILDYLGAVLNASATGVPHAPAVRGDVVVPLGSVLGINLIRQSEALDQSPWYGTGATVTADAVTAPDGTLTGDRVTRAINSADFVAQDVTFPADGSGVASVSLLQETSGQVDLELYDWTSAVARHRVAVTWSGGVPVLTHLSGAGVVFHDILAEPNGWYRVAFSATGLIAANQNSLIVLPEIAGSNGDSVSVWGAEVTAGSTLLPYVRTTGAPANIFGGVSGVGVANEPAERGDVARSPGSVSGTGSVHAPTPQIGTVLTLSGVAASGAVNAPVAAPSVTVALSAASGTATVNAPSTGANAIVAVGSVSGTGAIHAPNARGDVAIALTGVASSGVPNAPSTGTVIDASVALDAAGGTAAVNPPSLAIDAAVAVESVAATAAVNDLAIRGDLSVAPDPATGAGAANAPFVGFTVDPGSVAGTGAVNAPAVETARVVSVTGAAGSGVVNPASVKGDAATSLGAVAATGAVNAPTTRGDVSVLVATAAGAGTAHVPTANLNNNISAPLLPVAGFGVVNGPVVHIDEALAVSSVSGAGAVHGPSVLPSLQVPVTAASASGAANAPSAGVSHVVALAGVSGTGAAHSPLAAGQINTTVALSGVAATGAVHGPGFIIHGRRQFRIVVFAGVSVSRSLLTDVTLTRSLFTDVEVLPEGP